MHKFWQNNKDHFLQYFEGYGNLSPSEVYDSLVSAGAFKKMERIVSENTKFNCTEYLVRLEAELKQNLSKQCLKNT